MGKTKLMKYIYLELAHKWNSFDVTIRLKIPFFRVSVTIKPSHSLLQFVSANCLIFESKHNGHVNSIGYTTSSTTKVLKNFRYGNPSLFPKKKKIK